MSNTRTINDFVDSELATGYDPAKAAADYASRDSNARIAEYERDKIIGKRSPSGALRLKKLSARHMTMIALHLTGKFKAKAIADHIGCRAITVYRVLNDPMAQKIINDFHSGVMMDLKALAPLAVDAVRDGLTDKDQDTRLRAVDRFDKMTREHEEDQATLSVNVNFVNNVRDRFFEELRAIADKSGIIEVEAEEVEPTGAAEHAASAVRVEEVDAESA